MRRRRRHVFAAPLVVTVALLPACKKDDGPKEPDIRRPTWNPPGPDPQPAPPDAARDGDLELPRATSMPDPTNADAEIRFRAHSQDCWRSYQMDCPPGAKCNPPPPEPVACPDELLPTLVNGEVPSTKDDGTCWWGDRRVRC